MGDADKVWAAVDKVCEGVDGRRQGMDNYGKVCEAADKVGMTADICEAVDKV